MLISHRQVWCVAAFAVAACGISEPDEIRFIGHIDTTRLGEYIFVADSVAIGDVLFVRVVTLVAGGCQRASDTEIARAGSAAVITPYDVYKNGARCSGVDEAQHFAPLTFDVLGSHEVRIRAHEFVTDRDIELKYSVFVF